jgi:hypothetical protein
MTRDTVAMLTPAWRAISLREDNVPTPASSQGNADIVAVWETLPDLDIVTSRQRGVNRPWVGSERQIRSREPTLTLLSGGDKMDAETGQQSSEMG